MPKEEDRIHLLIVEDDPHLSEVIRMLFEDEGYQVSAAANGREGLDFVRRQKELPDIIVSDVMMPVMDGFQLCESLRKEERFNKIPFIFLTALSQSNQRLKAYTLGADDYLVKPFSNEELLLKVKILLDRVAAYRAITPKDTSMSGSLASVNLIDIIQVLELSRKTGSLNVTVEENPFGDIFFLAGTMIDAEAGNLKGEDALHSLLALRQGYFSFFEKAVDVTRTHFQKSNTSLIMEGLKLIDEFNQYSQYFPDSGNHLAVQTENKAAITRMALEEPDIVEILKRCKEGSLASSDLLKMVGPLLGELRTRTLISKLIAQNILTVTETTAKEAESQPLDAAPDIQSQLQKIREKFFSGQENVPLKILVFSTDSVFVSRFSEHFRHQKMEKKETDLATMIHFERVSFPGGAILHLYQLPVDKRFAFMWEALSSEAHAYAIHVNAGSSLDNAEFIHAFCQTKFHGIPGILVLQKTDSSLTIGREDHLPPHHFNMSTQPGDYDLFLSQLLGLILKEYQPA